MKNNFLSLVTKMPQNTGGGNSQTKRATLALPLRYLCAMLLALFMGIGQMWGDQTINLYYGTSKAVDGNNLNTEDFFFSGHTSNTGKSAVEIGGTSFTHYLTMSGYGASAINSDPAKLILYYPKKSTTTFTVYVQNKYNGNKKYYIDHLFEGETVVSDRKYQKQLAKDGTEKHEYTFTNTDKKNAVIALMPSQTMYIYQITVTESGDDLKQAGDNGYSFNTYRAGALAEAEVSVDGLNIKPSSKLNVGSSYFKIKQSSTYAKFVLSQKTLVTVGVNNSRKFIFCAAATPTDAETADKKGTGSAGNVATALTAGTWYLESESTSELQISNISFSIPTITYNKNDVGASGTMSSNTWTVAANGFTAPSGKKFDKWNTQADGEGDDVTVGTEVDANTNLFAIWKDDVEEYAITEATSLTGGSVDASAAIKAAGETVTITATPDFRYIFDAWDVYKTDDPTTKVSVTETAGVYTFEMPAYPVTVSATFTADSRKQILYLTSVSEADTKANDKLYAALNADVNYNVIIAAPEAQTLTNYDLVVLHESINGKTAASSDNSNKKQVILDIPTTTIPVLNTKSYFYNNANTDNQRWNWGTPNNGDAAQKVATLNTSYSNIADHPIFDGVTITANTVKVLTDAVTSGNTMQPIGTFTTGKEGYTLATTPNKDDDPTPDGCAIHELTPTQRGVASGKYLMISVSNAGLNNLTADGQKLFKNAAAYLMSATAWAPAAAADDDATLKALSVSGLTLAPTFDAATVDYTVTKAYGADDPVVGDVTATPTADGADVDVAWDGTNKKFTITVTALDNTTEKTYTITVNEAEAPKSLSRVLFSNGFDAFIDNTNHTVKAYYLAGQAAPTATTITAGAGTAGELSEGKIRVTGADDSYVDYIVTLEAVIPNTTTVAEEAAAGEFAGDEAWVKNGLLVYGNAAGYSAGDKWYVIRRLLKSGDAADDQRVIAGWVRSYFFVGNASKFIMTVGGNNAVKYSIDGGDQVANASGTLEIALTKGNHMIEVVSNQSSGDCRLSAPKLVELPPSYTVNYWPGEGTGATIIDDDATTVADCPGTFTAPTGKIFNGWKDELDNDVEVGAAVTTDMALTAQWINHYAVTFNMNGHGDAIDPQDIKEGAKATRPDDPIAVGFDFGGWFTDNGTFEAPFDFNTPITATTPLYAKWTADPCPDKKSIVKAVMATNTTATVTGYNSNEYAGGFIINNLADDASNTNMYDFGEGEVKGFKLKGSNSAIFATLSKGGFEVGDQVVFAVTKNAGDNKLAIYAAKDKDHVLKLVELDVDAAGIYTYRLTQDNIDAIEAAGSDYLSIGTFRGDYNPYIYSVELKGCRSWAIFHTLTFKNIDGTATIAAEALEEGAYASTVAPVAPKIAMKRFLGWAEAIDGTPVDLTAYTITVDKTLYAVYEDIVCPTTGTVYKFEIKDELPSENLPTSTDKDMSSYITATGDGYLTYTATANNKATINSDGTIQMKDASAAYLKVELECALAAGDQIRAHITSNPMRVQVAATYDSGKDLILAKNAYEFVAITSAMEGKQVLYITRSSNGNANLADFEIYRPAKYDVSFNMMGHGSAIADLEDVVEGSKIAAPSPAPTDADYSFAGWYKENTLENEWDFDGDVVETNTTLYAKWLDKSDATLKSLKYGETDIVLVVDQDTYDITLPSLTSSVPALTAETNNPNATKLIANGTFDGAGNATSTVTVTPEVGADKVYTVNFSRGVALEQATVTASTEWDWSAAGVSAEIKESNTPGLSGNDVVIANVPGVKNDADFNSQALKASGTNAIRTTYFQGKELNIKTDKEGMLIVDFGGTNGNARVLKVYDNADNEIAAWNYNSETRQVQQVVVPAGGVTLKAFEGASGNNARIYNLKFYALAYTRDDDWMAPGELGTVCYPEGLVAVGAEMYKMAGVDDNNKFVFDEVSVLDPGKPYLFVAQSNVLKFYATTATAAGAAGTNNGMVGTFESIDLDYTDAHATKWYYFSGKKFYSVSKRTSDLNVPANRAYVDMNTPVPAGAPKHGVRRITFDVQGANVATGVENAAATDKPAKMLINGQLFILRGEKMYDAKGQLVK